MLAPIAQGVVQIPDMDRAGERLLHRVVNALRQPEVRFRLVEFLANDVTTVRASPARDSSLKCEATAIVGGMGKFLTMQNADPWTVY